MEPVYSWIAPTLRGWVKTMDWDVRREGREHIPRSGPAVLATNHVGYLDWLFVGMAADDRGRRVRFLAKKEVFDHWLAGPIVKGAKLIPVDRYGSAQSSVDAAAGALGRGEVVGMFPEATISRSFVPAAGKTGSARMAMRAGAPLVPGAVWGSQRILTKDRPRNLRRHMAVSITFGPAIPYEPDEDPAHVTLRLMAAITDLVEQAAADYPPHPAGPDDRWWLPAHLGGTAPTVAQSVAMAEADAGAKRERRQAERR